MFTIVNYSVTIQRRTRMQCTKLFVFQAKCYGRKYFGYFLYEKVKKMLECKSSPKPPSNDSISLVQELFQIQVALHVHQLIRIIEDCGDISAKDCHN